MSALESLGYIGFLVVVVFAVTGGYVWLRWGFCGVATIWQIRERMDEAVRQEVEATVRSDAT